MLTSLKLKPRIEKPAGAAAASSDSTPGAPFAVSAVVRWPCSRIVCWSMTVTVAGVSNTVSPSRLALVATVPLLSGVVASPVAPPRGVPAVVVGAGVPRLVGAAAVDGGPRRAARRRRGWLTVTGGSGLDWAVVDCAAAGSGAPDAMTERAASALQRARDRTTDARRPKPMICDTRDSNGERQPVTAIVGRVPPSPLGGTARRFFTSRRNTPSNTLARDHCRWQISWLAG